MKLLYIAIVVCLILSNLLTACSGERATTPPTATGDATAPTESATTAPPPTPTSTPGPVGPPATLVDWIHQVDAHALPAEDWGPPQADMPIYEGGEVRTQEASTARVALAAELIRVAPNTTFTYSQADPTHSRVHLDQGQMWINVEGLKPGESFEVETPGAVAAVRGTRFSVRINADGSTVISAREGNVVVMSANATVTLTAGFESQVPASGAPGLPHPLSAEEQLRWGMASDAKLSVTFPAFGERRIMTNTGFLSHPTLSPDGCYLGSFFYKPGSTSNDKGAYGPVYSNLCTGEILTATLPGSAEGLAFSPEGDRLAFTDYGQTRPQICTQALDGSSRSCFGGDRYYGWPFWSPDGTWLVFYTMGQNDSGLQLYRARADGSEMQALTSGRAGNHHAQSWSPDGEWLAYIYDTSYDQSGELWIMRADGSDARKLSDGASATSITTWSPDGKFLAFASFDKQVWLATLVDDTISPVVPPEGHVCSQPTWAPTASGWPLSLLCKDSAQGTQGQWIVTAMEQAPQSLSTFSWGPIWSGNGKRVAFGRNWTTPEKVPYTEVLLLESEPGFLPQ